jgi:hypothetical protein
LNFLRTLLLMALILPATGSTSAAGPQKAGLSTDGKGIEIGSTFSFGQTPVGTEVSRSFRLVNEDPSRSMRIYGFWIDQDSAHEQWAITKKPDGWIAPGESAELSLLWVAIRPGVQKARFSWYVEMRPASEEEDKDNFFTFNVEGEALEKKDSP